MSAYEAMTIARLKGQIEALKDGASISVRHRLSVAVAQGTGRVPSEVERLSREITKARDAQAMLGVMAAQQAAEEQREPKAEEPTIARRVGRVGRTWRLVGDPTHAAPVATRGLVYWIPEWKHVREDAKGE